MLVGDFARIRIHATRGLARLDVAPYHGRHVTLIVHEARVEIGSVVWVCRRNMGAAAREWIF